MSCEIWLTTSPAKARGFAMPLQPQWWSSGGLRIGCDFERSSVQERAFWTTRRPRAWLQPEELIGRMHWRPCSRQAPGRRRASTASSPTQHLRRKAPRQRIVSSTHSLWCIQPLHLPQTNYSKSSIIDINIVRVQPFALMDANRRQLRWH